MLSEKDENKVETALTSSISPIKFLEGKNIFVFDTETTGLPERCPNGWGSYWSYFMNEKYENSRIISIAWTTIHNFHKDKINTANTENTSTPQTIVEHYLRYPEGFTEITNSHIHGITYEETIKNGVIFNDLLVKKNLYVDILKSEYIIAHNINFDYHVLMNELYRIVSDNEPPIYNSLLIRQKANSCIDHLEDLYNNGRVICTGQLSTNICKIEFPTKTVYLGSKKNYKMPKLSELYNYYYGCDFENAHSAEGDVKALIKCLVKM